MQVYDVDGGGSIEKPSSPVFLTHPFKALRMSCLTLILSWSSSDPFISAYFLLRSASPITAVPPRNPAKRKASIHSPLRHILLAPRGSICFRPCITPPIKVSCQLGVHTADI